MNTKQLIEVMQAHEAGKLIQKRDSAEYSAYVNRGRSPLFTREPKWVDVTPNVIRWNSARWEYRVKPFEPITLAVFAAVTKKGDIAAFGLDEKEVRGVAAAHGLSFVTLASKFLPSA